MEGLIPIVEKLATGGFAFFLVAILVAGYYRKWMWAYTYDEMVKEKDKQIELERRDKNEWKALVFQTKDLTDRSVSALSQAVTTRQAPQ